MTVHEWKTNSRIDAVIRVFVEKIRGWSFLPTYSRVIPAKGFSQRESCHGAVRGRVEVFLW